MFCGELSLAVFKAKIIKKLLEVKVRLSCALELMECHWGHCRVSGDCTLISWLPTHGDTLLHPPKLP